MASDGWKPRPFGPYLLLRPLGGGAMGQVHLARPLSLGSGPIEPVVVKQLRPELHDRKSFVQRFRHEAEVVISVDSPHVAQVRDAGQVGDVLYIALEYVPGWPLTKVLERVIASGRHAPIAAVLELVGGALLGLQALHAATDKKGRRLEIVHRDLSPKNLMVGDDGRIRIIDLGLGRSKLQSWRTKTGVVMGSVGYMAPEQARGERVDARADVYAMGVVLFEMLALRNYIPPGPVPTMIEASIRPRFQPPSQFRPDVPKALDAIVEKALAPNKSQRYASAEDLHAALIEVAGRAAARRTVVQLLEQLFGTTRQERKDEIDSLLGMTISEKPEGDSGPTQVFVSRSNLPAMEAETVPLVRAVPKGDRPTPDPANTDSSTASHTVLAAARVRPRPPVPIALLGVALLLAAGLTTMAVVTKWRAAQDAELAAASSDPWPRLELTADRLHALHGGEELAQIHEEIRRWRQVADGAEKQAAAIQLEARLNAWQGGAPARP